MTSARSKFTSNGTTARARPKALEQAAGQWSREALDSLEQQVAVLDEHGVILEVNRAWREFAAASTGTQGVEGANYLAMCEASVAAGDADGAALAAMIRAAMNGQAAQHPHEYACHTPTPAQWFAVDVRSFHDGKAVRIVVVRSVVTERRRAEKALAESDRRFREMLGNVQVLAVMLDLQGAVTYCNDHLLRVTGWTREQLIGRSWFSVMAPDLRDETTWRFMQTLGEDAPSTYQRENRILTSDGRQITVRWNNSLLYGAAGNVIGTASVGDDITERHQIETHMRMQAELLGAVGEAVVATDLDAMIIYANRAALELYGHEHGDIVGRNLMDVTFAPESRTLAIEVVERMRRGEVWTAEILGQDTRGRTFPLHLSIAPIRDEAGALIGGVGVSSDITDRRAHEEQVEYLATHDALTALPNRNLLGDRLAQAIIRANRNDANVGMILLDLDNFNHVSDGSEHVVGDALLKMVAQRLQTLRTNVDTVARVDGNQFVILLAELQDPLLGASKVARTLIESFAKPFQVDGREVAMTVSMGISMYPADGLNVDELLKNADAAMHSAKELGRNGYHFHAMAMSSKAEARVALETALRHALELGQFDLHYQPVVEMASGDAAGAEALIRWQHPQLGRVAPGDFIALAEETGLIVEIGDWVLKTACAQANAWQAAGLPPIPVAVNLSPVQLREPLFANRVRQILRESGLAPRYLNLEIGESTLTGESAAVIQCLNDLRAHGIALSVDNFGTGYSSIGSLTHVPLDSLKVDRSFVSGLPADASQASMARAVISMGRSLGMRVVAEGVESGEQAEFLQTLWCEYAQGYFYCRPLPAKEFQAWMRNRITVKEFEKMEAYVTNV